MKKFMAFLYKFSTIVMLIVGIVLCTLIATLAGLLISFGDDLVIWIVKSIASIQVNGSNLIPDDTLTNINNQIAEWFKGIHWSVKDLDVTGKVLISIFSINVSLLAMFVVFGILSLGYRIKVNREGKKALKLQKQTQRASDIQQYAYYSF